MLATEAFVTLFCLMDFVALGTLQVSSPPCRYLALLSVQAYTGPPHSLLRESVLPSVKLGAVRISKDPFQSRALLSHLRF